MTSLRIRIRPGSRKAREAAGGRSQWGEAIATRPTGAKNKVNGVLGVRVGKSIGLIRSAERAADGRNGKDAARAIYRVSAVREARENIQSHGAPTWSARRNVHREAGQGAAG